MNKKLKKTLNPAILILMMMLVACGSGQTKQQETTAGNTPAQPELQSEEQGTEFDKTLESIDGEEVIPLKYTSLYIHHFDNRSYDGQVITRLKEKLQVAFMQDGRLKVLPEKKEADLFLYGTVGLYKQIPSSYDRFGQPVRFQLSIIVKMKVRVNPAKGEDVFLDNRVVRYDTTYSPRVAPFETRFSAEERLLIGLTDRIVQTTFSGWYSELKTDRELGYNRSGKEAGKKQASEVVIPKDIPKEKRKQLEEQLILQDAQ